MVGVVGGGAIAVIALLSLAAFIARLRHRGARLRQLRAEWGAFRDRDRDMAAIDAYYRACVADDSDGSLDDRTWHDLDMNDVFSLLDRTESRIGQQALYSRLRAAPDAGRGAPFEALITRLSEEAPAREQIQLALGRLSAPAAYDLWRLSQPRPLDADPRHALIVLASVGVTGILFVTPFWPFAALAWLVAALVNFIARDRIAGRLRVMAEPFRHLPSLLAAAEALNTLHHGRKPATMSALSIDVSRLARAGRLVRWVGRDPIESSPGILSLLFDALNRLLWLDVIVLSMGAGELQSKSRELLRVIAAVGDLDAALSVASYREGTPGWTRPVFNPASAVLMDLRHPLLPDAVPNSITLVPPTGAIITGSNMSGKSTFLRTVGVAVVLAQTINTCLASHYDGPLFIVRSCIGRSDDPRSGKSYYVVEVEAVLAMVSAARSTRPHLMLFDELFRGTNAVERIAAGEAVLRTLLAQGVEGRPAPHVVMTATHDDELVDLLAGLYAPYHFSDTVDAEGLRFSYRLHAGPATTRNAIALLETRGAPPELIALARARAAILDRQRAADPGEPEVQAPQPAADS